MVDLVPETVTIQTFYINRKNKDWYFYEKFYVPGIKARIIQEDEHWNKIVTRSSFVIPEDPYTYQPGNTCNKDITLNTPLLAFVYINCCDTMVGRTLFHRDFIDFDRFISVRCIIFNYKIDSNFNITALKLYDENQYITCRKITCKKDPENPHYKIYIIDLSNIEINDYLSTTIEFVGSNIPKSFAYSVYYLRTSQPEPKQIY